MKFIFNNKLHNRLLKNNEYILLNLDSIDSNNICTCEYYNEQDKYYSKEYIYISNTNSYCVNNIISIRNIIYVDFENNKIMLSKLEEQFTIRKKIFYKIIKDINGNSLLSGYNIKTLNNIIDINTKNIYIFDIKKNKIIQPSWYKGNVYLTI